MRPCINKVETSTRTSNLENYFDVIVTWSLWGAAFLTVIGSLQTSSCTVL